jgi:hypothetical protein
MERAKPSVAHLISSLDGQYGFNPLGDVIKPGVANSELRTRTGSVFWFSIPLVVPGSNGSNQAAASKIIPTACAYKIPVIPTMTIPAAPNSGELKTQMPLALTAANALLLSSHGKRRLSIPEHFQNNCFREAFTSTNIAPVSKNPALPIVPLYNDPSYAKRVASSSTGIVAPS